MGSRDCAQGKTLERSPVKTLDRTMIEGKDVRNETDKRATDRMSIVNDQRSSSDGTINL
jgi:hypothetical protein